jgi:hypothetical protein
LNSSSSRPLDAVAPTGVLFLVRVGHAAVDRDDHFRRRAPRHLRLDVRRSQFHRRIEARVRIARGNAADVEVMLRRGLELRQRTYPAGHWRIAEAQALLGASLASQHRNEEAEALMRAADRAFQPIPGRQARDREANRVRLRSIGAASRSPARRDR